MKKILSYITTPLFYFLFLLALIIFHPIQVICRTLFGYQAHKVSVDILNYILMRLVWVIGFRTKFNNKADLPTNRPIIVVSNHQGTYDIPPIVWLFRKHHPKFISKIELAKGFPSISYNLRHSGAALIKRNNRTQALGEIRKLGKLIAKNNYCACIFTEGTRSKTGKLKQFKSGGLATLLEEAPNSLIVPFVVDGNYKIERKGRFPLSFGEKGSYSILEPIEPKGYTPNELCSMIENLIRIELGQ
ncbi:lysophospholipid acyltransferase family protein [Ancylomarina sp.]|uniref:lysophospholipid acyltransferase family protein n=1 Tax=Ancylomarina sp. TaxID=1970196 RepID=UPI003568C9FE